MHAIHKGLRKSSSLFECFHCGGFQILEVRLLLVFQSTPMKDGTQQHQRASYALSENLIHSLEFKEVHFNP